MAYDMMMMVFTLGASDSSQQVKDIQGSVGSIVTVSREHKSRGNLVRLGFPPSPVMPSKPPPTASLALVKLRKRMKPAGTKKDKIFKPI